MTALVIIEAVVILLLLILMAGLLKSHAEILRKLDRLGATETGIDSQRARPVSTNLGQAPLSQITGSEPGGGEVVVSLDHGRGSTLVAFLSSGCASCRVFWEQFDGEFELPDPTTRTVVVTKGTDSESPSKIVELAPESLTTVMSTDAWDSFRVPLTPYFVYINAAGQVIGEGSATTWPHLLSLLRQSAQDAADPTSLDTDARIRYANESLTSSGIEPDDPSLYRNPLEP